MFIKRERKLTKKGEVNRAGRKKQYSKIYNEKIKTRFVEEQVGSNGTLERYERLFTRLYEYESKYDRDVYDFSLEQLNNYLYGIESSSYKTQESNLSLLRSYIDWTIKEGYIQNNHSVNVARLVNPKKTIHMTSKIKERKKYMLDGTKDLREICKFCDNRYQHAVLFILPFYGLTVRTRGLDEVRTLKQSQCDFTNNIIHLSDRDINIPYEFMQIIKKAINQWTYSANYGREMVNNRAGIEQDMTFADTEYVVKKSWTRAYKGNPIMSYNGIVSRVGEITGAKTITIRTKDASGNIIEEILESYDRPLWSLKNIALSGMFWTLYQLEQDHELNVDDYLKVRHLYGYGKETDDDYLITEKDYNIWKEAKREDKEIASDIQEKDENNNGD